MISREFISSDWGRIPVSKKTFFFGARCFNEIGKKEKRGKMVGRKRNVRNRRPRVGYLLGKSSALLGSTRQKEQSTWPF